MITEFKIIRNFAPEMFRELECLPPITLSNGEGARNFLAILRDSGLGEGSMANNYHRLSSSQKDQTRKILDRLDKRFSLNPNYIFYSSYAPETNVYWHVDGFHAQTAILNIGGKAEFSVAGSYGAELLSTQVRVDTKAIGDVRNHTLYHGDLVVVPAYVPHKARALENRWTLIARNRDPALEENWAKNGD